MARDPSNAIARGANMANMLGAVRIRKHSGIPENKELLGKIPMEFGENEKNVALGLGSRVLAAAGPAVYETTAPKDLILRNLHVETGPVRSRVSVINIGADPALIGSTYPATAFDFRSVNPPTFDYYAKSGVAIAVTVLLDAAGTCDAGFSID